MGLQNEPRLLQRLLQLAAHAPGEAIATISESGSDEDRSLDTPPGHERLFLPLSLTALVGRQEEIDVWQAAALRTRQPGGQDNDETAGV